MQPSDVCVLSNFLDLMYDNQDCAATRKCFASPSKVALSAFRLEHLGAITMLLAHRGTNHRVHSSALYCKNDPSLYRGIEKSGVPCSATEESDRHPEWHQRLRWPR